MTSMLGVGCRYGLWNALYIWR